MTFQPNLKASKTEKMTALGQCTNVETALTDHAKSYRGPIFLPKFSTPANTDVGRDCEQPLVQVAFPPELAFEGRLLDRHHCNCQECPITSYSRPDQK